MRLLISCYLILFSLMLFGCGGTSPDFQGESENWRGEITKTEEEMVELKVIYLGEDAADFEHVSMSINEPSFSLNVTTQPLNRFLAIEKRLNENLDDINKITIKMEWDDKEEELILNQ